jgi:hypothetical protein
MEGTPLLDVMRGLILEPEAQADFAANPSGYMQRFGYDDVPEDDLREAVGLVADTLPPDVAHAVNTAAAAEPGDDDAYGDGTVGLLGRISTAEVTESVVPDLDEMPPDDAGPDDAFEDDLAGDHGATTFGEVTRDFDEDTADTDDAPADDTADDTDDADDTDIADEAGDTDIDEDWLDVPDGDVSFGDGGIDGSLDDTPEAFGQGSASFGTDEAHADELPIEPDGSFDDPGFDDGYAVDDDPAAAPDVPLVDDTADYDESSDDFDEGPDGFDGDPSDFDGDVGQF